MAALATKSVPTHKVEVWYSYPDCEYVAIGGFDGSLEECEAKAAEERRADPDCRARAVPLTAEPIHARSLVFAGFSGGDSCWSGRRSYQERKLRSGQVELVCGRGLDDVCRWAGGYPFVALKSKKSREAKAVTCPECARRIRAAGFVHAPKVQP